MKVSKVIVLVNRAKAGTEGLRRALQKRGIAQTWVDAFPPSADRFKKVCDLRDAKADLVIVCGGDGTMLEAAHRTMGSGIPLLGINTGHIGYMTALNAASMKGGLDLARVLDADYKISERKALEIDLVGRRRTARAWAVNDLVIARGDNPKLIQIDAKVGAQPLTQYRCDGLIVSTPTGSTAYNISAGGPIISPESDVLAITPICPHSLTNRSLVINGNEEVSFALNDDSGRGSLQADGMQVAIIGPNDTVVARTSPTPLRLVFLPEQHHFQILVQKLGWSGSGLE